jgi:hypothetical protein
MEAVTAFVEGPLCFVVVWGILARKPWRYALAALVSLGQFYGDVLYFATCFHGGAFGWGRGFVMGRGVRFTRVASASPPEL